MPQWGSSALWPFGAPGDSSRAPRSSTGDSCLDTDSSFLFSSLRAGSAFPSSPPCHCRISPAVAEIQAAMYRAPGGCFSDSPERVRAGCARPSSCCVCQCGQQAGFVCSHNEKTAPPHPPLPGSPARSHMPQQMGEKKRKLKWGGKKVNKNPLGPR